MAGDTASTIKEFDFCPMAAIFVMYSIWICEYLWDFIYLSFNLGQQILVPCSVRVSGTRNRASSLCCKYGRRRFGPNRAVRRMLLGQFRIVLSERSGNLDCRFLKWGGSISTEIRVRELYTNLSGKYRRFAWEWLIPRARTATSSFSFVKSEMLADQAPLNIHVFCAASLHRPNPRCEHPEDLASIPRMKSVSSIGSFTSGFEDVGLWDWHQTPRICYEVSDSRLFQMDAVGQTCNWWMNHVPVYHICSKHLQKVSTSTGRLAPGRVAFWRCLIWKELHPAAWPKFQWSFRPSVDLGGLALCVHWGNLCSTQTVGCGPLKHFFLKLAHTWVKPVIISTCVLFFCMFTHPLGNYNVLRVSVLWDFVTVLFVFYDLITLPLQVPCCSYIAFHSHAVFVFEVRNFSDRSSICKVVFYQQQFAWNECFEYMQFRYLSMNKSTCTSHNNRYQLDPM